MLEQMQKSTGKNHLLDAEGSEGGGLRGLSQRTDFKHILALEQN